MFLLLSDPCFIRSLDMVDPEVANAQAGIISCILKHDDFVDKVMLSKLFKSIF